MPRARTHSGVNEMPKMQSGPMAFATTGQHTRPNSEQGASSSGHNLASAPMGSPSMTDLQSQPVVIKRSAAGALGWLLLGAVLFGGIGALLYVALGERGERAPSATDALVQPAAKTGTDELTPDVSAGSGKANGSGAGAGSGVRNGNGSGGAGKPDKGPKGDDNVTPKDRTAKKQTGRPAPKKQVAIADEKDPKALIAQGAALERDGEWEQARGVYMKLGKIKGYTGKALYLQAWAAFQANDNEDAVTLAKKAAEQEGGHKIDALFLYGDALFKKGAPDRAKVIYLGLRKRVTGERRATATKKIAACNKVLGLPDADGIVN
jgi:tetratricopeptide (TPR) repeat protein